MTAKSTYKFKDVNLIKFTLRIPDDLYDVVGRLAAKKNMSVNSVILESVEEWIREEEKPHMTPGPNIIHLYQGDSFANVLAKLEEDL